jgi:hypothetical protein
MSMRKLKVIGLALVAIFAFTALASAASAAEFESASTNTTIKGEQSTKNVFTVNSRTVECNKATFTGFQAATKAATLEVHPEYSECTGFGLPATVTTTGCNYKFNSPTGSTPNFTGSVNIVSASGETCSNITVAVAGCTVKIGPQGPLSGISYNANGSTVTVTSNVTTIAANVEGSVLICGTNGARTGTYTGTVLTKGFNSGGTQVNIGIM